MRITEEDMPYLDIMFACEFAFLGKQIVLWKQTL